MSNITDVLAKISSKIGAVEAIHIVTMDGAVVASYPPISVEQAEKLQKYYYNLLDAISKILGINGWGKHEEIIMKTSNHQVLFYPIIDPDFYSIMVLPKAFTNFGIVKVTLKGTVNDLRPFLTF